MYSFEPNEEQQMLLEAVGRYAENDLRPAGHDAEEEGVLPEKVIRVGWEMGVLQASVPEAYGGFGERSAVTGVLAAEEMAFGDLAGTLAVNVPSLFVTPILLGWLGGTEERIYSPGHRDGLAAIYRGADRVRVGFRSARTQDHRKSLRR